VDQPLAVAPGEVGGHGSAAIACLNAAATSGTCTITQPSPAASGMRGILAANPAASRR
jgi:hypothetical protein